VRPKHHAQRGLELLLGPTASRHLTTAYPRTRVDHRRFARLGSKEVSVAQASTGHPADPNPKVGCSPPSGSAFQIGTTRVTCTATDASGNSATKSFDVVVKGAEDQVLALRSDLVEVKQVAARPLSAQLTAVQTAIEANRARAGCGPLGAFINFVHAQSGKGLTEGQASNLIVGGTRVSAVLDCP